MPSTKLSITSDQRLAAKYDAAARAKIASAVTRWIAADKARGITTVHLAIDDRTSMSKHGVPAVTGSITAIKVKRALDRLVAKLQPDYIVLFGAGDVIPLFQVPNPSAREDDEPQVATDNPYASSQTFSGTRQATYLVPDRVVGRIPDLPGSNDPSWLLDYLAAATRATASAEGRYAKDLLVCCDSWKASGLECVRFINRATGRMMVCPPSGDSSANLRSRHATLLHMIKCHGQENDSQFYGQKGRNDYPTALRSTSLTKRTSLGTITGAMCCFGASIFDPQVETNITPGEPPIPSVYLRQGGFGFLGSTTTAWVGSETMMCADWVVSAFLKAILGGASLGRAALESKQDFLRWIQQQGNDPDAPDQKTLLQFVLLGDPSIHAVKAASPAAIQSASLLGESTSAGAVMARRQRRVARHRLGEVLRAGVPQVKPARTTRVPRSIQTLAEELASAGNGHGLGKPRVERTVAAGSRMPGPTMAGIAVERRSSFHYYWASSRKGAAVRDIRLVSIHADPEGSVLRTQVVVSS